MRLCNGLHMPEVGLGTYLASGTPLQAAVRAALEGGIQHIDTASMYRVRSTSVALDVLPAMLHTESARLSGGQPVDCSSRHSCI